MNTWQIAAATDEYKQALKATASLTKDDRAAGFVEPHTFATNLGDTNIQRQNNTLIHLLLQTLEEVKALSEKVTVLSDRVKALESKKTAEISLPEDVITKLSEEFKAIKTGTSQNTVKGHGKGTFRVWK